MNKTDNRPFLEKHPLINKLIGFLLLIAFGFIGYYALSILFAGIRNSIDWLTSLASKLDAVVVVALITGFLSLLSVLATKQIEFKKARKDYLSKKREGPYGCFINMVYKIMDNQRNPGSYSEFQMKEDVLSFSKDITLWGSSRVAKKWVQFRKQGANPKKAYDNLYLIEGIMNEMRRDLGTRKLYKGGLLSFFINDLSGKKDGI